MRLNISPDMPPRHRGGVLCMQAAMHGGCNQNHDYYAGELDDNERRWLYVETILEELAALEPDSGKGPAGGRYEVDEVTRDEAGLVTTVYGTVVRPGSEPHPYILGDV